LSDAKRNEKKEKKRKKSAHQQTKQTKKALRFVSQKKQKKPLFRFVNARTDGWFPPVNVACWFIFGITNPLHFF
jgi:hypothetical protein